MGSPIGSPLSPLVTSFGRHLRARNLSPKTVEIYLGAASTLQSWLAANFAVESWADVRKADLETWLGSLLAQRSAGHASNQYRAVQQFFKWLAAEEEIPANPMTGMSPPKVEEKLVPVLSPDQRDALLKTCKGNDFTNRRDMAILRLFLATGIRLAEMTGILIADVDMDRRLVRVEGKGRRERIVRFDGGTAVAIDRYERSRSASKHAERPELWLAEKNRGVLTRTGIYQLVVRRGEMIGLDLNPHMFRHTFSHVWLEHGGAEGDLMDLNGWKSPQMLRRYGASARAERARTAYDRIDVMGDRRP